MSKKQLIDEALAKLKEISLNISNFNYRDENEVYFFLNDEFGDMLDSIMENIDEVTDSARNNSLLSEILSDKRLYEVKDGKDCLLDSLTLTKLPYETIFDKLSFFKQTLSERIEKKRDKEDGELPGNYKSQITANLLTQCLVKSRSDILPFQEITNQPTIGKNFEVFKAFCKNNSPELVGKLFEDRKVDNMLTDSILEAQKITMAKLDIAKTPRSTISGNDVINLLHSGNNKEKHERF